MWLLLWMNKLPECSAVDSMVTYSQLLYCALYPTPSRLFQGLDLSAQVGKLSQLCFFPSSNHSISFLLPHQQSTDLTPALSAPSCHPAPPKKTRKPYSSLVKYGLKTLLYLSTSIPSTWTQPICSSFIFIYFYKEL